MNFAKPLLTMMALASLTLTACSSTPGEVEEETATAQEAQLTSNGLTTNGLTTNGLTTNGLTTNGLTTNGLTTNGLTTNGLVSSALTDPNARELLKHLVKCALPAGEHVDITVQGQHYSYPGQLGLAPEWGEEGGSCGASCKQWVSACVLASVNYLGESLTISVRGENPGLVTSHDERAAYTNREATYFGNIFSVPQLRYACLSPSKTQIPRVCGPSIQGCVVDVVGSCEDVCGHVRSDGSFPDCWSHAGGDDDDGHEHGGDHHKKTTQASEYDGSITVFLKP
jgi:hypothetical protein